MKTGQKSVVEFLAELKRLDVKVWLEDEQVRINAPKGVMTPARLAEFKTYKTQVAALLRQHRPNSTKPIIQPASRDQRLPLAYAQQRLWFLAELESSAAYNIPLAVELVGQLDQRALQQTLSEIVRRHESLRTTFASDHGAPYQTIQPAAPFVLPLVDLRSLPPASQHHEVQRFTRQEAITPFDLSRDCLLRGHLLHLAQERFVLLLTLHHIAADGWSLGVFVREWNALYTAFCQHRPSPFPELPIQYADFALWQRAYLQGPVLDEQLAYWRTQLHGAPDLIQLPTDRPRPARQSFRGAAVTIELDTDLTQKLRLLSQAQNVTLYMTLLAASVVLLARYSGQLDLVVGSPIANRHHQELEPLIGCFVNTLALRCRLSDDLNFLSLLAQIKTTTQAAYDHQDLPFERLVEELKLNRSLNHNPLVQVLFALQNAPMGAWELPGLQVKLAEFEEQQTRLDLEIHCWEMGETLQVNIIYNTDLFAPATIGQMTANWQAHLHAIVADPTQLIFELPLAKPLDNQHCTPEACAKLAAALLTHPAVQECCVLPRQTVTNDQKPIAYLVTRETLTLEVLDLHLQEQLPAALPPYAYVLLTALPLDAYGVVDEKALTQIPVVDTHLLQRWENRLRNLDGVEEVAVVTEADPIPLPPYHLTDLLPGWRSAAFTPNANDAVVTAAPKPTTVTPAPSQRLAISDGGPLTIPPDAPKTLSEALQRTAACFPEKGITYVLADESTQFQSYAELLRQASALLHGLQQAGLRAGERVILQIEALPDYFPTFWACVLGGITPVTVAIPAVYEANNGVVRKLFNTWQLLHQPVILASDGLVDSLQAVQAALPMATARIVAIGALRNQPPSAQFHASQPEEVVFCQLTSGSTGAPKCIQETHRGIIAHIHGSQQYNGYQADHVSLNWLPMDHVVPLLTYHLKDVYLGCQQVEVTTNVILAQPLRWLDLMTRYGVTHSWSPNFGFKLVNDALQKHERNADAEPSWDLSSIRLLMNAGEQVTQPVITKFLALLAPYGLCQQAMQPAFGMAEVCTCMTYQNRFAPEQGIHRILKSSLNDQLQIAPSALARDPVDLVEFVDLGAPIPGVQIRITDLQNQPLAEGRIGRLQIKGAVVTPGYLYNAAANAEAFVGDGWFNSGDLGFILQGRLTITGREKESIIINGANFYCYEIEDVVNELDGVQPTYTAACSFHDPNSGTEGLAIFFTPVHESAPMAAQLSLLDTIRRVIATRLGITPSYVVPIAKSDFHKTTSGKIQRTTFQKALLAGEYQPLLRQIDLAAGNANTLPNWFYQPFWQRKAPVQLQPAFHSHGVLIFMDALGLGERLAVQLLAEGHAVIRVDAQDFDPTAPPLRQVGPNHYQLTPNAPAAYRQLLAALHSAGCIPDHLFHLWSYDACAPIESGADLLMAQHRGLESLLCLAQAWADNETACALWVISNQAQAVLPNEALAWAKAPLLGLLKTIPQELPWMRVRHIDLPAFECANQGAIDAATLRALKQIRQEIGIPNAEAEIAYRQGERFVLRLAHADWAAASKAPLPLQPGGAYLITGGLGGIGYEVAAYLLEHWQAKLLLVGRTPLSSPTNSLQAVVDEPSQTKVNAYQQLAQLPGQVYYRAVDICDAAQLAQAVAEVEAAWGQSLAGVFHLAGEYEEALLRETTQSRLAALLRAKMLGAYALQQLCAQRRDLLLVHFSSINSYFGGVALGAYAAANRFLDVFSHHQRVAHQHNSYCLQWSMWDRLGISRQFDTHLRQPLARRGYATITARQGVQSLVAALHQPGATYLIGLDGSRPAIQQQLNQSQPQQAIAAYYTRHGQAAEENLAKLSLLPTNFIYDRFGTVSTCRLTELAALPRTIEGGMDYTRLRDNVNHSEGQTPQQMAPRNASETQLAAIWQAVLKREQISVFDNFFALGGHSLLATQVISRINTSLQISLTLQQLFVYPTIAGLATLIERVQQVASPIEATAEEREEGEL